MKFGIGFYFIKKLYIFFLFSSDILNFKNELFIQLEHFKSKNIVVISKFFKNESIELYNLCDTLLKEANNNFQLNNDKENDSIKFLNSEIVLLKIQQIFKTINSKLDCSLKSSKKLLDLVKELIELVSEIDLKAVLFCFKYINNKNNFFLDF